MNDSGSVIASPAAFPRNAEVQTRLETLNNECALPTLSVSPALSPFDHDGSCGALILGGAHGSLAVARSLGRHGIRVSFVAHELLIPQFSRYIEQTWSWSGPRHINALEQLCDLARRHNLNGWVLYPGGDDEAEFVSRNHAALSELFRLTTPPWAIGQWAIDKHLTYQRAASLGIDHPRTYHPRNRSELPELDCCFPLVLKPATHETKNAFTREKAWRVDNRAELMRRYDEAAAMVGHQAIVIQELIPGNGGAQFSYAAVWHRGMPIASLVACRSRQFPIEFGYTSTLVQTVENKNVESAACLFLESLAYSGMVEIEFKFDGRDGRYKILDFNARTWTWCELGRAAGVDFPYALWRAMMGEDVVATHGRSGASWMHASRDVIAACQEMRLGRLSPRGYFQSLRSPTVFAAFAKDDPLPGVLDLPLVAMRLLTRKWLNRTHRSGQTTHA